MSSLPTTASRAATIHEVSAALRLGDVTGAEGILALAPPMPAVLLAAADNAMRDQRWAEAVWILDRVPNRDNAGGIKYCLCKNLASLQQHRPDICQLLANLPTSTHCGIGSSATRHPTIVVQSNGRNIGLSANNRPIEGLAAVWGQLAPVFAAGHALALCGIGDGYLLHELAHKPPRLFMDQEQPIFLVEPDAHIVLTALMIHDYAGPQGPIEQPRFCWFIGPDWAAAMRQTLRNDAYLPCPHVNLTLSLSAAEIQATLNGFVREQFHRDEENGKIVDSYYAALPPAELAEQFGPTPPRPPRVLFMTTRFSTVLQYATQDAAAGFQQAGWQTHVLIEPSSHHRLLTSATRAALAEFKPDLVFQIDHQRQEHPNMFPPHLPFVCWIQDHMPHLTRLETGERVGPTDFVLTDSGPTYVHAHGYPGQQIIALSKLTGPPPLLPRPQKRGEDIIFVSNASGTPECLLQLTLKQFAASAIDQSFITGCVTRLADLHDCGRTLSTYPDVYRFVREQLTEQDLKIDEKALHDLCRVLNHPVCDTLYRQQALRWAAAAARDAGLTLGLYGAGWDKHREFAAYARGPIAPGRDLHELTRRAAINLQIVPYLCLHQRLLDGIGSGAFFLIREHVGDIAPQALLDLLEKHCQPMVSRLEDARRQIPAEASERFEQLIEATRRAACPMGTEDPIETLRAWQEARLLEAGAGVLPHLAEVSFTDAASLRGRIDRFLNDPDLRDRIVADQRQSIVARLTYPAAMSRVSRKIGQLLSEQTPLTFTGIPINLDLGFAA